MNWIKNEFDRSNQTIDAAHCYIAPIERDDDDGNPRMYYTLRDFDSGSPVLGEFLNTYGTWETYWDAYRAARDAGYRCERKIDWE